MNNIIFPLAIFFCTLTSLKAMLPGEMIPNISAKNQDGKVIKLSNFLGQNLLIYFYPKDDTSGCTEEAKQLREQFSQFKKMNTTILGVSRQDEKSHQEFRKKYQLPFDLLVDTDGTFSKALGVGLIPAIGLNKRQSLLIDPKGKVLRYYEDVDPKTHAEEVLTDIKKFSHL